MSCWVITDSNKEAKTMQDFEQEIRMADEQIQKVSRWSKEKIRGLKKYKKSLEKSFRLLQKVSENTNPEAQVD